MAMKSWLRMSNNRMVLAAIVCAMSAPITATFAGSTPERATAPLLMGYTGKKWDRDYGVVRGHCERQALSARAGAERQAATLSGALGTSGAALELDDKDRACMGQALELTEIERAVAWTNERGISYRIVPLGGFTDDGKACREFVARIAAEGRSETVRHKACSAGDGVWRING